MKLAKPHIDFGLFTQDIAAHTAFWGEVVGLRLDLKLPLRRGWVQHRYDAHNSVVKVNHHEDAMPAWAPGGYTCLSIARDGVAPWEGQHPDGGRVRLVPTGTDGITRIGITVSTPDPARMMDFYVGAMEFERVAPRVARCGDTLLFVEEGPGGEWHEDFIAPGNRYLTVQIFDADEACAGIVARGGRLARVPVNYGDIARVGFVADPDGNWIEMSARASLTGVAVKPGG